MHLLARFRDWDQAHDGVSGFWGWNWKMKTRKSFTRFHRNENNRIHQPPAYTSNVSLLYTTRL